MSQAGLMPRKARAAGGESPAAVTSKQAPVVAPGAPPWCVTAACA